jgi:L-aspartate oxidase
MEIERTDFLVIGGGIAGLRAAIGLAPRGEVLVVTKDAPTESTTGQAQGGIAVALSDEDEVGIHYEDTINAGAGLSDEAAVKVLVEEGPRRIQELIDWGAEFDREGTKLAFTLEAAHSRRRVLHAHGDSTGRELVRVLVKKANALPSIQRAASAMVVDLIVHEGRCIGAYVLRQRTLSAVRRTRAERPLTAWPLPLAQGPGLSTWSSYNFTPPVFITLPRRTSCFQRPCAGKADGS